MPWQETRVTNERMRFIVALGNEEASMAALCRRFGISRRTGYKWLARWQSEGLTGLGDRSRAPKRHPNEVLPELVDRILQVRDRYGWGPKKLRVLLMRQDSALTWPAISTIEQILKDHGRVPPRRKRRRVPPQTQPLAHCSGPNAVWCCDFKGHFLTGEGRRCYPLTITDGFSRYLLRCQRLDQTGCEFVRPIFECAFKEYGLPLAIRSDNGPPFASRAVGGLSRLSVWWIKLGIAPERIEPGKPQQNGRHERMHLTLKQQTASPPASTARKQQERFEVFRREFNEIRPHEALGMKTPASVHVSSPRSYPAREPQVNYTDGWMVRKVDHGGYFYWKRQHVFLSEVLASEPVGLEPVDGRYWRTYFGPRCLGAFDSHARRMLTGAEVRRHPQLDLRPPQDRPSAALQDDPAEA